MFPPTRFELQSFFHNRTLNNSENHRTKLFGDVGSAHSCVQLILVLPGLPAPRESGAHRLGERQAALNDVFPKDGTEMESTSFTESNT